MTDAALPQTLPSVARLGIDGMHCAACVGRLEKVIGRQPGVLHAHVNLATESAVIEHDERWRMEDSIAAIRKAGFEAHQSIGNHGVPVAGTAGRPTGGLSLPAVLLSLAAAVVLMLPMLAGLAEWPAWLQFALATPVQFGSGGIFLRGAWTALRTRQATMDVLVALGSLTAWTWSTAVWVLQMTPTGPAASMPALLHGGHLFYEASASVIAFVLLGKWLEKKTRDRTASAVAGLAQLRPETVDWVLADADAPPGPDTPTRRTPLSIVQAGDRLRVTPATRIPCDGTVLWGSAHIDASALSGEPLPLSVRSGDTVHAGTLNLDGVLIMQVTATGETTLLGQVIRLIEKAQGHKLPLQSLADRIAAVFVPAVLLIAALTALTLLMTGQGVETALLRAVTVIVVACPCALGLATPAAIIAGTGAAARAGLLIRDPRALHTARQIDTVIFDKTGTLTIGHPRLESIQPLTSAPAADGSPRSTPADPILSDAQALQLAAGLQTEGAHPIGQALRHAIARRGLPAATFDNLRLLPGLGVTGQWSPPTRSPPEKHAIGEPAAQSTTADASDLPFTSTDTALTGHWLICHVRHALSLLPEAGQTALKNALAATPDAAAASISVLLKQLDSPSAWHAQALFVFSDQLRSEAAPVLQSLKASSMRLLLLSGDRQAAVSAMTHALPLDEAIGDCTPAAKAERVQSLKQAGHRVAMVGDGVNDAPAMALADLAIAMGSGTDIAAQTAHITLMNNQLQGVTAAIDIAQRIHRNIAENLFWAFAYNTVCIPLAAAGAFNPMMAAAAMAFSSVSVVLNALRLTRWKAKDLVQRNSL